MSRPSPSVFRTCAAVLLFIVSGIAPRSGRALNYRQLEPGLEYATLRADGTATLHLLRVDLKLFQVKVLDARDLKNKAMPVKTFAEKTRALAAINANFFDADEKPLGLVLQDGKLKNPPKQVSWWAALLLKGDRAAIAKVAAKEDVSAYDSGIQAGPRLVVAGKRPKLKAEYSPKSAVGLDRNGHLVFVVSEGSVEINRLAELLAKREKDGGAGLVNALNLDGGASTQFFAKAGDLSLSLPGFSQVPIALGLFHR